MLLGVLGVLVLAGCGGAQAQRSQTTGTWFPLGRLPHGCVPPELRPFGRNGGLPLPVERATGPSAGVLTRYALFRRPGRSGDAPPVAARALVRALASDSELTSVDVRHVRSVDDSRTAYVVPVVGRPEFVVPKRCPAALRDTPRRRRRYTGGPAYCTFELRRGRHVGNVDCEPFAAADSGAALFAGVRGRPEVALVPDGVATVRVSYLARPATLAAVHANAVVVALAAAPTQVDLLDRTGRVVQTIDVFAAARTPRLTRAPISG